MCWFLLLGIPDGKSPPDLGILETPSGSQWDEFDNFVLPVELRLFSSTVHCDCGTGIGAKHNRADPQVTPDGELERLIRLGWGEAQAKKWIEDHYFPIHLHPEIKEKWKVEAIEETEVWVNFFRGVFSRGSVNRLAFLLHWGDTSEKIEVTKSCSFQINELNANHLYEIEMHQLLILTSHFK